MFVVVTIFAVVMFVVYLLMRLPFAVTIFAAVMFAAGWYVCSSANSK